MLGVALVSTILVNMLSLESYTHTTSWSPPPRTNGSWTIATGGSKTFQSTDTVIEAPGSETTSGISLPWADGFDPLRDTVTTTTFTNTSSETIVLRYGFLSCQGFDKFLGNESGKVYKRNRSLWNYKLLGNPEGGGDF